MEGKKGEKERKSAAKKRSVNEINEMVPETDGDGLLYSKAEIRIMRKRARKGREDFILTPEEREEIRKGRKKKEKDDSGRRFKMLDWEAVKPPNEARPFVYFFTYFHLTPISLAAPAPAVSMLQMTI